jgi:hypothetical protein
MLAKFLKLRLDSIFFYLFVFLLPLEKKHVFIANIPNLSTNYSPWGAIEIYLTDIVFVLVLLFWGIHLLTQSLELKTLTLRAMTRSGKNHNLKLKTYKNRIFLLLLACFFLITIVSVIKGGVNNLEIYHLAKLGEYLLIFTYIILNIDTAVKLLYTMIILLFSSFFQAILGISQYFTQHSFNLKIFGEVDLSPQIQNVAKIVIDGETYIRAYGTLPHSNILGGFLFTGLIISFIIILLFILSLNQCERNKQKMFPMKHLQTFSLFTKYPLFIIFVLISAILFLSLILTFSRSAWLVLIFAVIILVIILKGLLLRFTTLGYKIILPISLLPTFVIISIIALFPQIKAKTNQFDQYGDAAIAGRVIYNKIAVKMVQKSPFFGIGYGNFVAKSSEFSQKPLLWWQNQPVHNIYLLVLAETGILGLTAFLGFIGYLFYLGVRAIRNMKNNPFGLIYTGIFAIFCGFLIIGLFDHYLWDIQQGSLIFWLMSGLMAGCSMWNRV